MSAGAMSRPLDSGGRHSGGPPLARLALPISRAELPGKTKLMQALGVFDDTRWLDAGFRSARMRWHGARVQLNTAERFERWAYFLGRYHEWALQLLMRACLRRGEVFVDVGANIGLVSLLGGWLVGPQGRVFSYEPNPSVFARLRRHVDDNGIGNVTMHAEALGECPGTGELAVIGANTGSGTLGTVPPQLADDVRVRVRVPIVSGDHESEHWLDAVGDHVPTLIKVDAEGFETRIVKGLRRTLSMVKPLIVLEVNPFALGMNKSSPRELRAELHALGYSGRRLDCRHLRWKWRPYLAPLPELPVHELHDEVWAHPEGPHWPRIAPFVR